MDYISFKEAIIARCQQLGVKEYELYYQAAESTSLSAYQQEINQFAGNVEGGVCFRCIIDGKMGYASTEELSQAQAEQLVARAMDNAANLETVDQVFLGRGGQTYEPLEQRLMELPDTEELIQAVLDTQKTLYETDSTVVDGTVTHGICEKSSIAICNSNGLDLNYVNQITGLIAVAVVDREGEKSNSMKIRLAPQKAIDHQQLARETVAAALEKLGGQVPDTGVYPVIFSPKAMAQLLGTYAGIFSSEAAQKGLSKLAGREGEQIAATCVTLVDDPFHPESPSPIHFDAEGSPTRKKNLVEEGTLKTLLYNLKTADKAGKTTTGNASKASYQAQVGVRAFSLYLAPGAMTEEQLLAKAGEGIYINNLEGLHAGANAVSGDFSLQSAGYRIEKGVKTDHIKSFTVAGNFYELLNKIIAVADNVELNNPMGITSYGSPSVLVDSLSIAGK